MLAKAMPVSRAELVHITEVAHPRHHSKRPGTVSLIARCELEPVP